MHLGEPIPRLDVQAGPKSGRMTPVGSLFGPAGATAAPQGRAGAERVAQRCGRRRSAAGEKRLARTFAPVQPGARPVLRRQAWRQGPHARILIASCRRRLIMCGMGQPDSGRAGTGQGGGTWSGRARRPAGARRDGAAAGAVWARTGSPPRGRQGHGAGDIRHNAQGARQGARWIQHSRRKNSRRVCPACRAPGARSSATGPSSQLPLPDTAGISAWQRQ